MHIGQSVVLRSGVILGDKDRRYRFFATLEENHIGFRNSDFGFGGDPEVMVPKSEIRIPKSEIAL